MGQDSPDLAAKAMEVHRRLVQLYGQRRRIPRREPMHELVATMLSHRTTQKNEAQAYERMWQRFGSWEAIRDAPLEELAQAIRGANFEYAKAGNIQKALRVITEAQGKPDIGFLGDLSAEEGRDWLMQLPGVGIKTASLVLLFCFGKPLLPVDTHVHRVSWRVGLIAPKVSAEKAHHELLALLPPDPEVLYNFHVNMLHLGQRVCLSRSPRHGQCPLTDICDYYLARHES
ncbi:MAG: endonuclease III domain-containing protein [Anaerolineae bacterium]